MLQSIELVEINEIIEIPYNGIVYDLEVEEDHSYNINDIMVHNSGCLTRVKTGIGYPQFSAIVECSEIAHELGAYTCSDGGCKTPGDVSKALAVADFVMLGSMLAGHDECDAKKVIDESGKEFVEFYGMSSEKAMNTHNNGMEKYRTSEGRHVLLPSRGSVETTILDILGGLRSTCSYIGAHDIKELHEKATFIKVNETYNKIYEKL
jgi:GMP reductase